MPNSCSLQSILSKVLAVGNAEQNMAYPPYVYTEHYRTVTSLLISKCVKEYPSNNTLIDIIEPFVKVVKIPVTNGNINLQAYQEYRNLLSTPYFNLKPNGQPCGEGYLENAPVLVPQQFNANSFRTANLRGGCRLTPLVILPADEFAYRTSSEYNYPTHQEPIGYLADKWNIQVCPYDLPTATVMYVIQETPVQYGYTMQPDDTYIYNPATSVETQWTSAAFEPVFKGVLALYSAYLQNQELTNFTEILKGILV